MRKAFSFTASVMATLLLLSACGMQSGLADMKSVEKDGLRCVVWEDRMYVPFCVISKQDRGAQIDYVNGNKDDRISEYKWHPLDEWLVNWLPMDGGAMLLKEEDVVDIPDGLEKEY